MTGADEITWVTDQIAVTNYGSAHDRAAVAELGIGAVLCLDRDLRGCPSVRPDLCVRLAHLVDGPNTVPAFRRAVQELADLVGTHGRVLVHCRAGRSRSVAVVAAFLKSSRRIPADEALRIVTAKRPSALARELAKLVATYL